MVKHRGEAVIEHGAARQDARRLKTGTAGRLPHEDNPSAQGPTKAQETPKDSHPHEQLLRYRLPGAALLAARSCQMWT